jgi:uncharacterized Tic20 family protein
MSEIPSTPPEGTPGVPPSGPITPSPGMPIDYSPPAAAGMPYVGPPPTQDEKTMGMLAHLLAIVTWFVGPLIIWMMKKDQSPFVNDQGREALNFQITIAIAGVGIFIIGLLTCVGMLLWPALFIVNLVFCLMAGLKAKDGIAYRYPFTLRLIK